MKRLEFYVGRTIIYKTMIAFTMNEDDFALFDDMLEHFLNILREDIKTKGGTGGKVVWNWSEMKSLPFTRIEKNPAGIEYYPLTEVGVHLIFYMNEEFPIITDECRIIRADYNDDLGRLIIEWKDYSALNEED